MADNEEEVADKWKNMDNLKPKSKTYIFSDIVHLTYSVPPL